jgi:hypothetical protein
LLALGGSLDRTECEISVDCLDFAVDCAVVGASDGATVVASSALFGLDWLGCSSNNVVTLSSESESSGSGGGRPADRVLRR